MDVGVGANNYIFAFLLTGEREPGSWGPYIADIPNIIWVDGLYNTHMPDIIWTVRCIIALYYILYEPYIGTKYPMRGNPSLRLRSE